MQVLFILCFFNETAFVMAFLLAHAYSNSPTAPTFVTLPPLDRPCPPRKLAAHARGA